MNSEITFLIPVYNAERYLPQCVNSILEQTDGRWKAIFVDDGSTDSSAEILSKILDPRVKVFTQSNSGPSAARALALKNAETDYVVFLDADDYLSPEMVGTVLSKSAGEDIIVYNSQKIKQGEPGSLVVDPVIMDPAKYSDAIFTRKAHGCLWNKCIKRSLFGQDIMFPRYAYGEDRVLCIQLANKAKSLVFIGKVLHYYRKDNPSGLTKSGRRGRKVMEAKNHLDLGRFTEEAKYTEKGAWIATLYGIDALKDYREDIKKCGWIKTLPARIYLSLTERS